MCGAGGDGAGGDDGYGGGDGYGGSDVGTGFGGSDVGTSVGGSDVGVGESSSDVGGVGASDSSGAGAGSARTPPRSARAVARAPRRVRRRHHYREDIGTAVSADCPATLATIPLPPTPKWVGLTTEKLKAIAITNNINGCALQSGVAQNRTIGIAFETWVLKTNGQLSKRWRTPIPSQARANANVNKPNGLPKSVIPEFVDNQVTFSFDVLSVTLTWNYFPNSMFYEVKAITGNVTLGTSQWQILGLLDVATSFPTVPTGSHAPPGVVFNTTSNTVITQAVVDQGTMWGVGVWQGTVYYDANSATPDNPNLRLGDPVCLNPSLYPMAKPGILLSLYWIDPSSWADHPLTWPTVPEQDSVVVPGDPDSPAVN